MKDIRTEYGRLASALECWFTGRRDKMRAAICLRNWSIMTPVCSFCGWDKRKAGTLYASRYDGRAFICEGCTKHITRHGFELPQATNVAAEVRDVVAPDPMVTSSLPGPAAVS